MGLFPGNRCIAAKPDADDVLPVEVELIKVQTEALTVQPATEELSFEEEKKLTRTFQTNSPLWLHPLLNPVPFDRRLDAISSVKQTDKKCSLITGSRPVEFSSNRFNCPTSSLELNKYQLEAVYWADAADDLVCIHGPPGTGKTRTLTAYVDYAVSQDNRVLVTAHSNQAVDNLLAGDSTEDTIESETLHAMAQDETCACTDNLRIFRAGNNSTHRAVQTHYANKSSKTADVVAATMSGASQFDTNEFDVVVVDEATQASRPATAIALDAGKKLVLAGDHKQLPPYCSDETMKSEEMHISLFEYLLNQYGEDIAVRLKRQYRMNKNIAAWPNKHIYNGNLETADKNKYWQIDDLEPLAGINIAGGEARAGTSWKNTAEAAVVADEVDRLLDSNVAPSDIGIISGYTGQLGPIKHEVDELNRDGTDQITIDTVDSFQGGEREAIIVSFVRSNDTNNSGFLTFAEEGPRRLNVAVTRARKRLVLVGDWNTLGTIANRKGSEESCANLYQTLANTLRENGLMQDMPDPTDTT
jgi:superfamily I DNA and/or RNA helicase